MTDDNNVVSPPAPPVSASSGAGGGGDYGERLARLETRIEQTATKEDVEKLRTEVVKGVEKLRAEVAKGGCGIWIDKFFRLWLWVTGCTASVIFIIFMTVLIARNSGN